MKNNEIRIRKTDDGFNLSCGGEAFRSLNIHETELVLAHWLFGLGYTRKIIDIDRCPLCKKLSLRIP